MPIILRPKHIPGLWRIPVDMLHPEGLLRADERTPDTYRVQQATYLLKNPAASAPVEFSDPIQAFIGSGCWRINCACGEATHADPEWGLSCCFGCGAIYTNIIFPDNASDLELLLTNRRIQGHRNWDDTETVEMLVVEQLDHKEYVPEKFKGIVTSINEKKKMQTTASKESAS